MSLNANRLLATAALALLFAALWAIQHPWAGLFHDSQIYTLQALARIETPLASDIYLRFGSQDQFTLFSPLYAIAIRAFDVARAAELLTFLSQMAFVAAAILLARRLLPGRLPWLALGLSTLLPVTYGAQKVLYLAEDFITPRLLAQAVVLAAIALVLMRRYVTAGVAFALAAITHPVMTLPGLALLLFLDEIPLRWRRIAALAGVAVTVAVLVILARRTPLTFDAEWFGLLRAGLPYLFVLDWRTSDVARAIIVLSVLYAAFRHLPTGPARSLARATLILLPAALGVSIIGTDVLHLTIITQVQPWRALWLGSAIALLLTPWLASLLWKAGDLARASAFATLAAFLLADERYAFPLALLAAALTLAAAHYRKPLPSGRAWVLGSGLLAGLAVAVNLGSSVIVARALIDQSAIPLWLRAVRFACATGVLPMLVLLGGWLLVGRLPALGNSLLAAACAVFAVFVATAAFPQWATSPFDTAAYAAFEPWRARIPPEREVLWFDQPVATWTLLRRQSYISNVQTATSLFSRDAALAMHRRLTDLDSYLQSFGTVAWRDALDEKSRRSPTLADACSGSTADFVVSTRDLGAEPIEQPRAGFPAAYRDARLYECLRLASP
jgi:hypothetical protein